jgi:hypothetical protein
MFGTIFKTSLINVPLPPPDGELMIIKLPFIRLIALIINRLLTVIKGEKCFCSGKQEFNIAPLKFKF